MTHRQRFVFGLALCAAFGLLASYKYGPRIYNRYRLSQLQGRQVYDEKLDTKAAFQRELARANREKKRLLVMMGGNWCQWCLALDDLMDHNAKLREYLDEHYVVLKLDSQAAHELDDAWGQPSHQGVPVLIFLDAHGAVRHVQETGPLELWNGRLLGHDPKRVLSVLKRWA